MTDFEDKGGGHQLIYGQTSGGNEVAVLVAGDGSIGLAAGTNEVGVLGAGENHVGAVGGHTTVVAVTPTITAGAYSAKDAVGGSMEFTSAARVAAGSGVVHAVTVIDDASQSAELVLVLFDQSFTATDDNDAYAPSDADLENCLGQITVSASDYQAFDANAVAQLRSVGLPFKLPAGTSIFGQLMCTGTPTYAATGDLTVKLHILQD